MVSLEDVNNYDYSLIPSWLDKAQKANPNDKIRLLKDELELRYYKCACLDSKTFLMNTDGSGYISLTAKKICSFEKSLQKCINSK